MRASIGGVFHRASASLVVAALAVMVPSPSPAAEEGFFDIFRTQLDNGLKIWVREQPDTRTVAAYVAVYVGSRDETPENNGVSHFLEHMVFTGTKKRSEDEIESEIRRRGAARNGFTNEEYTGYYIVTLDTDVEFALDWLLDIVFSATLPAKFVERERDIVFQENAGRRNTFVQIFEKIGLSYSLHDELKKRLFSSSSLRLPVIGEDASLERIQREDLVAYYRRHYLPSNATLIVAGNVRAARVVELAQAMLKETPTGPRAPRARDAVEPLGKPTSVVIRGPLPSDRRRIHYGFLVPGTRDGYRSGEAMVFEILAKMLDTALFRQLRLNKGMVYSAFASYRGFRDIGMLYGSTSTDGDNAEAVVDLMREQFLRISEGRFADRELEEAKRGYVGEWSRHFEGNREWGSFLLRMANHLEAGQPIPDVFAESKGITRERLIAVAKKYFRPERSYLGVHDPVVTFKSITLILLGISVPVAFLLFRRLRRRRQGREKAVG
jgi:predicted Zn-dependent peptidase